MPTHANESQFEAATLQRLTQLGYRALHGRTLDRALHTVVLNDLLHTSLHQRYPSLPAAALDLAVQTMTSPEGVTLEQRNRSFQQMLRSGFELPYEQDGESRVVHIFPIAFGADEWALNDFLVVQQLTIQGQGLHTPTRRPDLILYINGLPLVVFELKSPWDEYADVAGAHTQIQHYTHSIPQLFTFNCFCVISDGVTTLHGMHNAGLEWYAPWKSIDGQTVEPTTTSSMKTLLEGLFTRERLLEYLRHFIVHEQVNGQIIKKGAKYHQFFAVRVAVQQAVQSLVPGGSKRVGVIWHTQGSGKSLSMIFLVGILRRWSGLNPSIVVQVDRSDLDKQLYESFVAAHDLVGTVQQAENVADLRTLLQQAGGEVICSTIEKFRIREGETSHPVLSERDNILVIADEAHRTQYNLIDGFAAHLRRALPNAAWIGFTGTPIDRTDANTIQIFGDYLHTYDMQQAREDNAVVGLYYEARHIPLGLGQPSLDQELDALIDESEQPVSEEQQEALKRRMSALERVVGTPERLTRLAHDLLAHFTARQQTLLGKAMVVCMTRAICVRLYDLLTALPSCPEVKIVMTGDITSDPPAWSAAGHITTKQGRDAIKARFVDPDDPLKIVIVCDMWLTGFDAPCVNTIYIDKKMQGHTLMQAIARVNRVFRDKPGGLIVDYIQLEDQLRAATQKYTAGGGQGTLTADLATQAVPLFLTQLEATRATLPAGQPYAQWRTLSAVALDDLSGLCYGTLAGNSTQRTQFLDAEYRLSAAYSLISHVPEGAEHHDEVAFYQMIRKQVRKLTPAASTSRRDLERAVQDILDTHITAHSVVDIFRVAGLDRPDISILDETFLGQFSQQAQPDLQARLLATLMQNELHRRERQNLTRARSFQSLLEATLTRYNNSSIQAIDVVRAIWDMHRQIQADDERKAQLNLSDEELAFYDVIVAAQEQGAVLEHAQLIELVRDVVQRIRENVRVDWTKDHRQDVYASVQSAVSRVLRRHQVRGTQFELLRRRLMEQAAARYADWPLAA